MLRVLRSVSVPENELTALCWGPPGLCAGDMAGVVYIWPTDDTPDGGLCHIHCDVKSCTAHKLAVSSLCTVGSRIFSCALDGSLVATDTSNMSFERIAETIEDPIQLRSVESDSLVLIGNVKGTLSVYSVDQAQVIGELKVFDDAPVVSIAVHKVSKKAFILSPKELVMIDIVKRTEEKRMTISADLCTCCAVTDDGYSCVVTTTEGTVRVVDVISFKEVGCIVFEKSELNKIAPVEYGKRFIVTSMDGRVGMFDIRKMIKEKGLKVGKKPLIALALHEKEMKIAVAGCDNAITLLDLD